MDLSKLVNVDRYPIHEPGSAACRALANRCREMLRETGSLALEGFLRAGEAARLAAEFAPLERISFDVEQNHTVYFAPRDPSYPGGHPRRATVWSSKGGISYDQIPADSDLTALYKSDAIRSFIADVLELEQLYLHDDPLAALNVNYFRTGQTLAWHFDRADFATTLLLQAPTDGGAFEYYPDIRAELDENFDTIANILCGNVDAPLEVPQAAGTLSLFRGRHALHRVAPVGPGRTRIVAVLSYTRQPGRVFQDWEREQFYGHSEPLR